MSVTTRSKRVVARYGPVLAVLLALVGVIGLGSAVTTYTQPQVETTTVERFPQTVSAGVQTSAVVTGNTSLYEEGESLSEKPVYLLSASPNVTLAVTVEVPDGVQTKLTERVVLELRGTKDGRPFWEEDRVLINRTRRVESTAPPTAVTINVSRLEDDLAAVREEVGQIGVFETRIRLKVAYTTNRYNGTLTATAPLQITDRAYWIDGDLAAEQTRTTTVTERVRSRPAPIAYLGPGLAGALALVAAGAVWVRYRDLDLTAVETEISRSRYEEWISDGEFPSGPNKRHIRINSLEDLIDVAIDSNKRVIYDETYQAYAVADGDLVYYFAENPDRVEAWFDI